MKKILVAIIIVFLIFLALICFKIFQNNNLKKETEDTVKKSDVIEVNQKEIYKKEENNTQNVEETTKYIIKSGENFIEVYENKNNTNTLIEVTEIPLDYLTEEDKETLNTGIEVNSKEDIKKVLEDYE